MKYTLKTKQDIEDFVRGCAFYGTGGGGPIHLGVEALMKQLEKGNEISWVDAEDVDPDDYTCCPFLMGSIAPETDEILKEREQIYGLGPRKYDDTLCMVGAIRSLEEITGKTIKALIPIELGGGNTASCVAAAAEMGIAAINGDYTGRAIPEIQQTTPYIYERELLPVASFDGWGNKSYVTETENWRMTERIGKMIAAAGYSKCAQAGFCMKADLMEKTVIKGTLSECLKLGRAMRLAFENGEDPCKAAIGISGGWIAVRGIVTEKKWYDQIGYYWGTHTVSGSGEFEGTELKIWFKNENHISWKNDKVFATSPDMIQVVDNKTGMPLTNDKIEEGLDVTVIVIKAREPFRSERGLYVLSPKAFGYDYPYVPLEELV